MGVLSPIATGDPIPMERPMERSRIEVKLMSLNELFRSSAVVLAVLLLSSGGTAAIQAGDPEKGKEIADRDCARCRNEQAAGHPPTFEQIARTPHYTPQRLRRIIAVPPHRGMPALGLNQSDIEDLAAYIRSLRKPAVRQ